MSAQARKMDALKLENAPMQYLQTSHRRVSPLEKHVGFTQFEMPLTMKREKELVQACHSGFVSHILSFLVPACAFVHGTFDISEHAKIQSSLCASRVESTGAIAQPIRTSLLGRDIRQLLALFHLLSMRGRQQIFDQANIAQLHSVDCNREADVLSDCINDDTRSWYTIMQSEDWSPMLIEECVSDQQTSGGDEVVAYRFWLHVHRSRNIDEDLRAIGLQIDSRWHENAEAEQKIRAPPKKPSKRAADAAPEEPPAPPPYHQLLRPWEIPFQQLLGPIQRPALVATTRGCYNVALAMADYLKDGNLISLPPACFGISTQTLVTMPFAAALGDDELCDQFDQLDLEGSVNTANAQQEGIVTTDADISIQPRAPIATTTTTTTTRTDSSSLASDAMQEADDEADDPLAPKPSANPEDVFLDQETHTLSVPPLGYEETRFLPCLNFMRSLPPVVQDDANPCAASNIFNPFSAAFTAWNCNRINKEQRNPLSYFRIPGTGPSVHAELAEMDPSKMILDPRLRLQTLMRTGATYGAIISGIPVVHDLSPSALPRFFQGFPRRNRVRVLMPTVMPWALPLMPLPSHFRTHCIDQAALPFFEAIARSARDKINDIFTKTYDTAHTNAKSRNRWCAVTLLAYMSAAVMNADNKQTGAHGSSSRELSLPAAASLDEEAAAKEKDQVLRPCLPHDLYDAVNTAQMTLYTRFMHARNCLAVAPQLKRYSRDGSFVSHICYEGRQLTEEEAMSRDFDLDTVASALDLPLHLSQQTSFLLGRIQAITGQPSVKTPNRSRLFRFLKSGVSQFHRSALLRAVESPENVLSLSPAVRACFMFYGQTPVTDRWLMIDLARYGNLSPSQHILAWLVSTLMVDGRIFMHTTTGLIIHLIALGSHARDRLGIGTSNSVVMYGPNSGGKSVVCTSVILLAIPNTVSVVTSQTDAAENIQGNNEGLIRIIHELSKAFAGGVGVVLEGKDIKEINMWKALLEGGCITTKAFNTGDDNKRENIRTNGMVVQLAGGSMIGCQNPAESADAALNSRVLRILVPNVSGFKAPEGAGMTQHALNDDMPVFNGASRQNYRILQSKQCLAERFQQAGALPRPYMKRGMAVTGSILAHLYRQMPHKKPEIRLINHIRNLFATGTKLKCNAMADHNQLQSESKFMASGVSANGLETNSRVLAPFHLPSWLDRIVPSNFMDKHILFMILSLVRDGLDDTNTQILYSYLARLAYPSDNDLSKVKWYVKSGAVINNTGRGRGRRQPPGGFGRNMIAGMGYAPGAGAAQAGQVPEDLIDYNYVDIELPGRSKATALNKLGSDMTGGNASLRTEQLFGVIAQIEESFVTVTEAMDANRNGPPALDAPILTRHDHDEFHRRLEEDQERVRRQEEAAAAEAAAPAATPAPPPTAPAPPPPPEPVANALPDYDMDSEDDAAMAEEADRAQATAAENDDPRDPLAPDHTTTSRASFPLPTSRVPEIKGSKMLPTGILYFHPDGTWHLAILDHVLRAHRNPDVNPATSSLSESTTISSASKQTRLYSSSTVMRSICYAFESSNLEVYPPEMIDALEKAFPALVSQVTWVDPDDPAQIPLTLRQYLKRGCFRYLTGFNDVQPVVDDLMSQYSAQVTDTTKPLLKKEMAIPRHLAESPILYRNSRRAQMSVDLTAPTEHDAEWVNSTLPTIDVEKAVSASEYDMDWDGYYENCTMNGLEPFHPQNLQHLPIVGRWVAEAKRERPGRISSLNYPFSSVDAFYRNVAKAQLRTNEKEIDLLGQDSERLRAINTAPTKADATAILANLRKDLTMLSGAKISPTPLPKGSMTITPTTTATAPLPQSTRKRPRDGGEGGAAATAPTVANLTTAGATALANRLADGGTTAPRTTNATTTTTMPISNRYDFDADLPNDGGGFGEPEDYGLPPRRRRRKHNENQQPQQRQQHQPSPPPLPHPSMLHPRQEEPILLVDDDEQVGGALEEGEQASQHSAYSAEAAQERLMQLADMDVQMADD